jgi:hypothetical protein
VKAIAVLCCGGKATNKPWNLRTDDLEQQSDETVSFIAALLWKDGIKYIDERTGDVWETRHKHGILFCGTRSSAKVSGTTESTCAAYNTSENRLC